MANAVLDTAIKEYRRWRNELARTAAYRNMKEWEQVILDKGGKLPDDVEPTRSKPVTEATVSTPRIGKKARIKALAIECIRESEGQHAPREKIHAYLEKHEIYITLKRVSAYLSTWKDTFVPDRDKGWGIKKTPSLAA